MLDLNTVIESGSKISNFQYVEYAREGVSKGFLDNLADLLDVKSTAFSNFLSISVRSLQRYKKDKMLPKDLSDHTIQIARIVSKATEVFEDKDNAVFWLKSHNIALGGIAPLELLDTYSGIEVVMDELLKIEYGSYA